MSFEEIETRPGKASGEQASITLFVAGGASARLPNALVSIGSQIGSRLNWQGKGTVALQIGRGPDSGKIRLSARPGAPYTIRPMRHPGTWQVQLGHVPEFGNKAERKRMTTARLVDPQTVEIDLPAWQEAAPAAAQKAAQAAREFADAAQVPRAPENAPVKPAAPKLPPAPQLPQPEPAFADHERPGRGGRTVSKDDVTLKVGGSKPYSISNGRSGLCLNDMQADFLEPLVRALGALIPTAQIVQQAGLRAEECTWLDCDLRPLLKTIGLHLSKHGPFYSLKKES